MISRGPVQGEPGDQDRRRRIGIALVLGFFTLGGIWLLAIVARDLLDYHEASQWPTVSAELIGSTIEELPGAADGATAYGVVVRYRYTVAGQTYESDQLRREGAERFTTREAAAEVLAGYLRGNRPDGDGSPFSVYVNPADPTDSVVNVAPPTYLLLFVAFYWAILLVFLIPAVRTWWQRRGPDRS